MPNTHREYKHKVSVIIPKRRGEDINQTLLALADSVYTNFEIIVVDKGLERSAQRNIGIKKATGEYLLILDSDQHITPHLIWECVKLMEIGFSAVYIPEYLMTKGWFGRLRNWERQFYTATPIDVVRFVRAKNCPLFDKTMSGPEDSDWDRRVPGIRVTCENYILHYENVGFWGYFKKKAYYAKSMKRFAELYPDDPVINWKWRCFKVFFEKNKYKKVLQRVDLMIAVWLMILIRGVIYLWKR
jgi:glycosyltransferase involved in cell wall biosynthesis